MPWQRFARLVNVLRALVGDLNHLLPMEELLEFEATAATRLLTFIGSLFATPTAFA